MNYQQVEILLVEDSAADAEMTRRTLRMKIGQPPLIETLVGAGYRVAEQ